MSDESSCARSCLFGAALVTKGRERHDATVAHIDRLMTISLRLASFLSFVIFQIESFRHVVRSVAAGNQAERVP
jgi:hypothetical protein